jgi:sulfur-carrier protein
MRCALSWPGLKPGHDDFGEREMPHVVMTGTAARRFTGGETEFDVEANTVRRMIAELDRRYPGLGEQIDESMAVAIDGEIFQDAYLAPLKPDSEVVLIPKIGGG